MSKVVYGWGRKTLNSVLAFILAFTLAVVVSPIPVYADEGLDVADDNVAAIVEENLDDADASEDADQTDVVDVNDNSEKSLVDDTVDLDNSDAEVGAVINNAPVSIATSSDEIGVMAVAQSGKIANAEGVEDAILWSLSEGGMLTVGGEGGIPASAFRRNNANSVFGNTDSGAAYDSITEIVIEDGITAISGSYAFAGTGSTAKGNTIKKVTLPASLKTMAGAAFQYVYNIESLVISPNSQLEEIGNNAFTGCADLIIDPNTLPDSVKTIGQSAFASCAKLKLTSLPSSLSSIGASAFNGCSSLALTELPNGVTSIGDNAFSGCSSLAISKLPDGLETVGKSVFLNCVNIAIDHFPDSLISIGTLAFSGCTSFPNLLSGISISSSTNYTSYVVSPSAASFPENTVINVRDSGKDKYLAKNIFWNYDETSKTLTISGDESPWTATQLTSVLGAQGINLTSIENVVTAGGMTEIPEDAFKGFTGMTYISIDGIKEIRKNAFYGCTSLTSAKLPDSVVNIGNTAFQGCTSLESITLSEGLATIGSSAFWKCAKLKSIDIPASVKTLGAIAFMECTALESVNIAENSMLVQFGSTTFQSCPNLKILDLSTTSIEHMGISEYNDDLLINRINMTATPFEQIILPKNLITLGTNAIAVTTKVEKIVIPSSVNKIYSKAFTGVSGLTSVIISPSLKTIASDAINGNNFSVKENLVITVCGTDEKMDIFDGVGAMVKAVDYKPHEDADHYEDYYALEADTEIEFTCDTCGHDISYSVERFDYVDQGTLAMQDFLSLESPELLLLSTYEVKVVDDKGDTVSNLGKPVRFSIPVDSQYNGKNGLFGRMCG